MNKSIEEIVGELYCDVSTSLDGTIHSFVELARHIRSVLGENQWKRPIWKVRVLHPDNKLVELDKFEDYLLKPVREGFGMPSLYAVDATMKGIGREGKLALDAIRKEIPDWDARVENERVIQTSKEAKKSPKNGEVGRGRPKDVSCDYITPISRGSTSAEYLASRIKRDAPEIAKRLERGEFKSIRAAAKAAGIVKDKSQIEIAKSALKRMNEAERNEFLSWVNGE